MNHNAQKKTVFGELFLHLNESTRLFDSTIEFQAVLVRQLFDLLLESSR